MLLSYMKMKKIDLIIYYVLWTLYLKVNNSTFIYWQNNLTKNQLCKGSQGIQQGMAGDDLKISVYYIKNIAFGRTFHHNIKL